MNFVKKNVLMVWAMIVSVCVLLCTGCAFEVGKGHGSLVKLSGELSLCESSGQVKTVAGKNATVITAGHEFPDFAKWGAAQSASVTAAQEGSPHFNNLSEQEAPQNNVQVSNENIAQILRANDIKTSRANVRD